MLNRKGFITLTELILVIATMALFLTISLKSIFKNREDQKAKEIYNNLYNTEENIKLINEDINNRFIIIPHDDHWGGKAIRVDTIRDTNTGKSYIIFRGYDGITALEIK